MMKNEKTTKTKNAKTDNTVAHLQHALENIQNNIRYIDTKVAGAMGLVAIVPGLCVSRSVLANQLRFSGQFSLWYRIPEMILVVLAVAILVIIVFYASRTLFPRTCSDPRLKNKTWGLFPMAKTDAEAIFLRDTLETKFAKGIPDDGIVEEYIDQLAILGNIQAQKIDACKSLFKWVWGFSAVMLLLGAVSLLCYIDIPFLVHGK